MLRIFFIIGALIGFKFFKLQGAVAGAALGFILDSMWINFIRRLEFKRLIKKEFIAQKNQAFIFGISSILARVAVIDANLQKAEQQVFEQLIRKRLKLNRKERRWAKYTFDEASRSGNVCEVYAYQFYEVFKDEPYILESIVDASLTLAVADGDINREEEELILSLALMFKLPDEVVIGLFARHQIFAEHINNSKESSKSGGNISGKSQSVIGLASSYAILGCKQGDSMDLVKKSYRKMLSEYHPDRIMSKDLPKAFEDFANEKVREVTEAYQKIVESQGSSKG